MSPSPMKRSRTIGLQVFLLFFFFLSESGATLSPLFLQSVRTSSSLENGETCWRPRVSRWMTLRKIAEEARRPGPTCRPHSSRSAPAAEGHLAPSPASSGRAGERASTLPHHPHPSFTSTSIFSQCCPATVLFTQSLQTHHFTSLAELLALEGLQ